MFYNVPENKEMEHFMYYLVHDTNTILSECRKLFLERFPGQERYWDMQIYEWLD